MLTNYLQYSWKIEKIRIEKRDIIIIKGLFHYDVLCTYFCQDSLCHRPELNDF